MPGVDGGHLESMLLVMLRDLSKDHVVPSIVSVGDSGCHWSLFLKLLKTNRHGRPRVEIVVGMGKKLTLSLSSGTHP